MQANFGHGPILNSAIPFEPHKPPLNRLPGVQPLGSLPWLIRNETAEAQLALKAHLWAMRPDAIYALDGDEAAADELAALVSEAGVALDASLPSLAAVGLACQEDFCLLEGAPPFRLIGALLAFPASWKLAEKIGRPLFEIHEPIREYDRDLSARVERIMANIHPDAPLWRCNHLRYAHEELHWPNPDTAHSRGEGGRYLRVERQILRRLPKTGAIAFSILTYLLDRSR